MAGIVQPSSSTIEVDNMGLNPANDHSNDKVFLMQFTPLLLLPFLTVAVSDPVTVRTQSTRGGPQIHVDGKPIPRGSSGGP